MRFARPLTDRFVLVITAGREFAAAQSPQCSHVLPPPDGTSSTGAPVMSPHASRLNRLRSAAILAALQRSLHSRQSATAPSSVAMRIARVAVYPRLAQRWTRILQQRLDLRFPPRNTSSIRCEILRANQPAPTASIPRQAPTFAPTLGWETTSVSMKKKKKKARSLSDGSIWSSLMARPRSVSRSSSLSRMA